MKVTTEELKVGDIVRIRDNTIIPADCVVLASSTHGKELFTKTQSLDGETNLKPKLPIKKINEVMLSELSFDKKLNILRSIKFTTGAPDADLYNFKGSIEFI